MNSLKKLMKKLTVKDLNEEQIGGRLTWVRFRLSGLTCLRLLSGWAQANLRLFPVLIGPAHGPQH
jgi:hypothetical protein